MRRAILFNLEHGLRRLIGQLPDELQFRVRERVHTVILIQIGPHLSVTRGINNTIGCVRKRRGGNRWSS